MTVFFPELIKHDRMSNISHAFRGPIFWKLVSVMHALNMPLSLDTCLVRLLGILHVYIHLIYMRELAIIRFNFSQVSALHARMATVLEAAAVCGVNIACTQEAWSKLSTKPSVLLTSIKDCPRTVLKLDKGPEKKGIKKRLDLFNSSSVVSW